MNKPTEQIIAAAVEAAIAADAATNAEWLEKRNHNTPTEPRPTDLIVAQAAREAARTVLALLDAPTITAAPAAPSAAQMREGKNTLVTIQRSQYVRQTDTYVLAMSAEDAEDLIDGMGDEGIGVDYTVEGQHVGQVIDEADNPEMVVTVSATIGGRTREADIAVD